MGRLRSAGVGIAVLASLAVVGFVVFRVATGSFFNNNGTVVANVTPSPAPSEIEASAALASPATSAELASASPEATAVPTASPTPVPASLVTARPMPAPLPQPTGDVNYLRSDRGAIVRAWSTQLPRNYPRTPLDNSPWQPPSEAGPGPYVFVFELPVTTSISRLTATGSLYFSPPDTAATGATPPPAANLTFALSTQSADSGFTDAGSIALSSADSTAPPGIALAQPVQARFVRITMSVPPGARFSLNDAGAFGTQDALPAPQIDGAWYLADLGSDSIWIDATNHFHSTAPVATVTKASPQVFVALHNGADAQFARCDSNSASADEALRDDGSHRFAGRGPTDTGQDDTAVIADDGRMLIITPNGAPPSIYLRAPSAPKSCAPLDLAGKGSRRVIVLAQQAPYGDVYVPAAEPTAYPAYRFVPIFAPLVKPADLQGADTLVFGSSCQIGLELQPWQTQAILQFVESGHKLIIHDADTCNEANYSFLPYPLALVPTGAQGAKGGRLLFIENDPLGVDATSNDKRHFIDVNAFVKNDFQQIGDSDVIVTDDPHWCGHLLTTNVKGVSGYVQAYAHDGKGLIIYDGLDHDNYNVPQYQQLIRYELDLPLDARLPCSHAAGGFTIVPSQQRHEYVPGKAQPISVDLQALAIMTYQGTIGLTVSGPYPATLSPNQLALQQNVAPFGLVVNVPKDARGPHRFTVTGTDASGRSVVALVDLVPGKVSALEKTLQENGRITLHNILFDTASAKLRPESYAVLSQIADALGRNRGWRLSVQGHTDSDGGAAYNLDLSQRRAASVKTALVQTFHIDAKRLQTKGFGLTRPVASNATDSGKQLNRRVELVRI